MGFTLRTMRRSWSGVGLTVEGKDLATAGLLSTTLVWPREIASLRMEKRVHETDGNCVGIKPPLGHYAQRSVDRRSALARQELAW